MSTVTCRFDPQQMTVWSDQTGIRFVSNPQEGYRSAKPFLLEQKRKLLGQGWREGDKTLNNDILFHIYIPTKIGVIGPNREIILPETFESFLDPTMTDTWKMVFEQPKVFKARHAEGNGDALHPDLYLAPQPQLSNIFHLLQIMAPGMLVIHVEYTSGNVKIKASRALPTTDWIERSFPKHGSITLTGGMGALVSAATDPRIAFLEGTKHPSMTMQSNANKSQVSSKTHQHNLPFPVVLTQPDNLKTLQTPNRTAEDGKDVGSETRTAPTIVSAMPTKNRTTQRAQGSILPGFTPAMNRTGPVTDLQSAKGGKNNKKREFKADIPMVNNKKKKPSRSVRTQSDFYSGNYGSHGESSYGSGYDWALCDKDCGWCGHCND